MEEIQPYKVKGNESIMPEVHLAAKRLADFLTQFSQMTDAEKETYLKEEDKKRAFNMAEFHNELGEYLT